MIPIGTELTPRNKADPAVTVSGIEASNYVLAPVQFASPFLMNYDEITSTYICDGFAVHVDLPTEAESWAKLSGEKFRQGMIAAARRERKQDNAESPEMVFAREERERAEAK